VHRAVVEALRAADIVPRLQVGAPGANLKGPAVPPGARPRFAPPAADAPPPPPEPIHLVEQVVAAAPPPGAPGLQLDFIPGFGVRAAASSEHYVVETRELSAAAPRQGALEPEEPPGAVPYAEPAAREEASLIARLRAAPASPRAVAQVGETYILAEAGPLGMLIIDQHAAHEKIHFLQFMREAEAGRPLEIQPLMIPHTLEVAPAEAAALESLLPALKAAGFDVEPFGGGSFIIQSLPVLFERLNVPAFLRDLIDDVGQGDLPRELQRLLARISARAACRAALKAGDELTLAEMQRLVDELMQTEEALRCPHGRPTVLLLTREQIDRQFGRI
jgi:DNA mismatch repair protein MutL